MALPTWMTVAAARAGVPADALEAYLRWCGDADAAFAARDVAASIRIRNYGRRIEWEKLCDNND